MNCHVKYRFKSNIFINMLVKQGLEYMYMYLFVFKYF